MSKLNLDLATPLSLPQVEEIILNYWDEIRAFERSVEERPSEKPYVFYDGPPFVTGSPHYGSILGSIAKDVVPRYWTMKGYRVERQWGWDCHGLPMEHMIEKELGLKGGKKGIEAFGIANFNNACRDAIKLHDATWEKIIRRIGRWVDFKHSYKTMDTTYMESVWWAFQQLWQKDLVYEGRKVILYCPRCGTPLSNFEIAMDNSYLEVTEPSNTYKYQVEGQSDTYLLAWSTTPWNKLATPALAVNPQMAYIKVQQGSEKYILAESRLEMLTAEPYEILEKISGRDLVGTKFVGHYDFYPDVPGKKFVVIGGDFVTSEGGTGIVTLAVYGEDDYQVMKKEGIQLIEHVDEEGRLKPEVTPWAGQSILKVNPLINEDLVARGLMYKEEPHTHSIATCYRCGTRLYYAPIPAWFIDVQKLKPQLIAQNEKINWYPSHLKHGRFGNGLEAAPDWNISRSRYWATPMPIWVDETGEKRRIIGSIAELQKWAVEPNKIADLNDIHREFIDDVEVWIDDAKTIKGKRIAEVFDVWVDSGSMPYASRHYPFANQQQFEQSYPAQFISEYIAQTRAWFYCMHVLSVGLFEQPSFTNAHTTGVILAEDGTKMSKSKKNYPDPTGLLDADGADALRLYLMASPVTKAENLAFSAKDVSTLRKRVLNIWWNVFMFFHTYKLANWTPTMPEGSHVMDRWILALIEKTKLEVTHSMDTYDLTTASRLVIEFVNELSTWYLRQSRDRLRAGDKDAWNTFHYVLEQFSLITAPIVPFISEAIYLALSPQKESVHLELWPEVQSAWLDEQILQEMAAIRPVVEAGHWQRKEQGIKVRQPLAKITVISPVSKPSEPVLSILAQELNVKSVIWDVSVNQESAITLDTQLTPELQQEGQAREIIRSVQQARKEASIGINARIDLVLPEWPSLYENEIREKTKAQSLTKGDALQVTAVDAT
jgi:isoleucyl-tRNA synthetase